MNYLFPPEAPVGVPVAGRAELFPVRRVYCVGRNYAAHAREMGFDPDREPPFFFCKPANAVVVCTGGRGRDVPEDQALSLVAGYAVGLDMTRRDLQFAMRDKGRPWDISKAFDHSAPIAPIVPVAQCGHVAQAGIWLTVDGQARQRSDITHLIWSVPEIVSTLSRFFELAPGDLIYTGTPEGVAAVQRGQLMHGGIDGLGELKVPVA
jgi:fumarylpyruvate hydrolase